jgi:hypothetical protein
MRTSIDRYRLIIRPLIASSQYLEADIAEQKEMVRDVLERRRVFRELIWWRDDEILRQWRSGSGVPVKKFCEWPR